MKRKYILLKRFRIGQAQWLMPEIPAMREVEIRRTSL
jgi:hypothetical protein